MKQTSKELHEQRLQRGQRRVALWLSAEQLQQLQANAETLDMTVSEAIRLALEAAYLIEAT
jgi:hypothetical protein